MPFVVYEDREGIIKKIDKSKNNPENLSTIKVSEHQALSGFSMSTISLFGSKENNFDVYRSKNSIKRKLYKEKIPSKTWPL